MNELVEVGVAHERVLLLHPLELPVSRYWRFKQNPCCISELDFGAGGFVILGINQTDHLREAN
jgi:probable phosphoglycerate mutase